VNAETAAVKAAAAAADARITASEERLLSAAGRIEHSMETMRAELLGKVEAIQGTVASTQQSMARAEARIEALGKENDRLQVNLDVEEMRRQILENKLRAQGIELD
jgi:chromosome segregation ATPase